MKYDKCMRNNSCKNCKEKSCEMETLKYHEHITIDYKLDNWNDTINKCRSNYNYANKQKKKEMDVVRYHLLNIKKINKYPIKITCVWHIKNSNSDLDNKSLKSVLDQMQLSGILENDNVKHIQEISYKYLKDTKDYLEMYIDEMNGE